MNKSKTTFQTLASTLGAWQLLSMCLVLTLLCLSFGGCALKETKSEQTAALLGQSAASDPNAATTSANDGTTNTAANAKVTTDTSAAAQTGTDNTKADSAATQAEPGGLSKVVLALDYTPNTNHTGLFVAQALGYFAAEGLDVEIQQAPEGGPELLVAANKAQFGISFQDTIAAAWAKPEPLPVTAVAAILQHNTSGLVSLQEDGIARPKDLEGKVYATWSNPIELAILRSVVEQDGGDFAKVEQVPLEIFDTIAALKTDIDAVWIYYGWDGIALELAQLPCNYADFRSLNPVFDYYTPMLIASNSFLAESPELARAFLAACSKGYAYAQEHIAESAKILLDAAPELNADLVLASQKWLSPRYQAEAKQWGEIASSRWNAFYEWLATEKLIDQALPKDFGFSNDYLPQP